MRRKENVPEGAKKKDKHYRPWLESPLPAPPLGECCEAEGADQETLVLPQRGSGEGAFPTHYHGIPFTDILKKYWEVIIKGLSLRREIETH